MPSYGYLIDSSAHYFKDVFKKFIHCDVMTQLVERRAHNLRLGCAKISVLTCVCCDESDSSKLKPQVTFSKTLEPQLIIKRYRTVC